MDWAGVHSPWFTVCHGYLDGGDVYKRQFVAYSQATKLPYVTCDEETYNDQAWIFATEEGIKEDVYKRQM